MLAPAYVSIIAAACANLAAILVFLPVEPAKLPSAPANLLTSFNDACVDILVTPVNLLYSSCNIFNAAICLPSKLSESFLASISSKIVFKLSACADFDLAKVSVSIVF